MAIYFGVLEMFAGETKVINSSPPASVTNPPDISGWTLESRCSWTDGSGSFVKPHSSFEVVTPNWALTLEHIDTLNNAGRRLEMHNWRVDSGEETELDWGFINVRK